jgi:hypothetical protein
MVQFSLAESRFTMVNISPRMRADPPPFAAPCPGDR